MDVRALRSPSMLLLGVALAAPACATSSPENYVEKAFKLQCKFIRECDEAQWEQLGYDSLGECRDDLLTLEVDGEPFVDAFVDACTDFDRAAARQCLRATRKQIRECDLESISSEDQDACGEICGEVVVMSDSSDSVGRIAPLRLDPDQRRYVIRVLEHLEQTGQLDEP